MLRFGVLKRFLRVNVADLRKGDWIELENGRVAIINHLASSHSGRGSRSFLVKAFVFKDYSNYIYSS